ncbi:MAG TPA: hypothetical protein VGD40_26385 [Chryseosolibacter sp.]
MTENEVNDIAKCGIYKNAPLNGKVEETHISWVILTRKHAFKVKKPVRLDFLDFSSVEYRKIQCERELELNKRFSDIYLAVEPVRIVNGRWVIGGGDNADVVDYCVVMRRMAISKRMDNVLRAGRSKPKPILALAADIAAIHSRAEKNFSHFEMERGRQTFNEVNTIRDFAIKKIGRHFGDIITQAANRSDEFLKRFARRIQERIDHGLKRDVHGDLHCRNVFLYNKPVIFDCIEFKDEFRQIDVLYEVAFLCMDIEAFRHKHLSDLLLAEYKKHFPVFQKKEDHELFGYYKALRANIRAKVHALQCQQSNNESEVSFQRDETRKYLVLMNKYMANLNFVRVGY